VHDNGLSGVTIEGGRGNSIGSSAVANNAYGIWLKAGASGTSIADTRVTASERAALRLTAGAAASTLDGALLAGQRVGISAEDSGGLVLHDVRIASSSDTAIELVGPQADLTADRVLVEGAGREVLVVHSGARMLSPAAAVDSSAWQGPAPPPPRPVSLIPLVKAIPWLLILLPILVLWAPARIRRSRRRRRRASMVAS